MAHRANFTAQLSNKQKVYDVCKALGFVQTRGPGKGEGSPRALLEAIASGRVRVELIEPKTE